MATKVSATTTPWWRRAGRCRTTGRGTGPRARGGPGARSRAAPPTTGEHHRERDEAPARRRPEGDPGQHPGQRHAQRQRDRGGEHAREERQAEGLHGRRRCRTVPRGRSTAPLQQPDEGQDDEQPGEDGGTTSTIGVRRRPDRRRPAGGGRAGEGRFRGRDRGDPRPRWCPVGARACPDRSQSDGRGAVTAPRP